jgi:hypothetical protein
MPPITARMKRFSDQDRREIGKLLILVRRDQHSLVY